MSIRKIIQIEVKRQGISGYRLAQLVDNKITARQLQAYLAGDVDMSGERISMICEVLGLELKLKRRK